MRVWGETNTHAGILGGFGRPPSSELGPLLLACVLAPGGQGAWGAHDVLLSRTREQTRKGRCATVKKETPQKSQRVPRLPRVARARVSPASEGRGGLALVVLVPGSREPRGHPGRCAPLPWRASCRTRLGTEPSAFRGRPHAGPPADYGSVPEWLSACGWKSSLGLERGQVRAGAGRRWARGHLPWKHGGIQNVFLHCTSLWKKDRKC